MLWTTISESTEPILQIIPIILYKTIALLVRITTNIVTQQMENIYHVSRTKMFLKVALNKVGKWLCNQTINNKIR